jgi:glycosyltransferase involved in cell wall biosynthesis
LDLPVVDDLVSVIVPAHDEARVIERMVASMRAQREARIELVVVLDRCTDDTLARLEAAAENDPRIRPIVNDSCPDDWAGKCHAASVGAAAAQGDWLLFTDADVRFDADVVRSAVAIADAEGIDLLSAYTRLTSGHWWEAVVQPPAAITLLRMFPPDRTNHVERPRSFANGQFMLFRRAFYDHLGGHAAVKDDLLEDLAFAKAVHRLDGRVRVVDSGDRIQTSMYESLEDLLGGWRRIFIESCHRNIGRMNRNVVRVAAAGLGPVTAIASLGAGVVAASLGGMLPRIGILGWPLGCLLVAGAIRGGAVDLARGRPVRWGGRAYLIEPERSARA